jgi:hypothetical protein
MSQTAKGTVSQVMGPVVDVCFEEGHLPSIHNALTMTKGGTGDWWIETDNLAIGLLANNCGYGWKHPEIAEGLAVCGGYAGFARYTVDANGKISNTNWLPEITDSKSWNGKAHKVVCVYDTSTVLFTFFDLGEVPAEIN